MTRNKYLRRIGVLILMATSFAFPLHFTPCDNPCLNQKAEPLTMEEISSKKIQQLIHEMLVLSGVEADPKNYEKSGVLVGLAAPQVGVMKQIIIVNINTMDEIKNPNVKPKFDVLINPKVIWESDKLEKSREGCFSVPEQYMGMVNRPVELEVEAIDPSGQKFTRKYKGHWAQIVHHEIDHLNGIRFPQRLSSETQLHCLNRESDLILYRKNWKNWEKHATQAEWLKMKNGDYSSFIDKKE